MTKDNFLGGLPMNLRKKNSNGSTPIIRSVSRFYVKEPLGSVKF